MQQKIVNEFNRRGTHYPRDKTIHELFEEQVRQCPDSMALVGGKVRLTYQQLNSRANQLAHLLINQRIVPGDRVAFCLERYAAAILAILAILKSGAVYVPLDASYPNERLNLILADTATPFLISSSQFAKKFSGYSGLDHWQTTLDQWPSENPTSPSGPVEVARGCNACVIVIHQSDHE